MNKEEELYRLLGKIPNGKITTYKAIAAACGISARKAGSILSKNPNPIIVPCHRVVRADGKIGGYTWKGKIDSNRKIFLLRKEGTQIKKNKVLDFESKLVRF